MIAALAFFGTLWGRVALIAALLAALVALRAADVHHQRKVGETRAITKIEKSNEKAVDLGRKAAAKSRAPATGRVRAGDIDPTTRND